MRLVHVTLLTVAGALLAPTALQAQSSPSSPAVSVPRLINLNGVYTPADGQPPAAVEAVTLAFYAEPEGGTPLWQETQSVAIDAAGRYALLLGATYADGIPPEVFASGDAQWLGMMFARAGEVEGPRVRITSVPYALRSADAETLGGRPASAYLLAPEGASSPSGEGETPTTDVVTPSAVLPGTTNFLAKYVNGTDVGNSGVYETAGMVGVGTTSPFDTMHVRFTNTGGSATGLAVQNLGNTATSYSGMLFYDQNGALGQFQGFNNVTHEYRINNVARNGASQFDGSINFMIGSTSRFFVGGNGSIGIGTTSPTAVLEVSNAASINPAAAVAVSSYSNSSGGSILIGNKARGTSSAPSAVQNGDTLLFVGARGYGTSAFGSVARAAIAMRAAENFTDAAQGASIRFRTTPVGSTMTTDVMAIDPSGNVGIGTSFPSEALEVARSGADSVVASTSYNGEAVFITRVARGTPQAPTAVQAGDELGALGFGGYGATFFNPGAGMVAGAAENWTDTAHGSVMGFFTTPIGAADPELYMAILPNGFVGIGTPPLPNGDPTATDRLQVFGDIRVGTTGTNGCVKRFDGTGLAGTCASDRRFKRNVTPFGNVLGPLAALQPVHYFWRAAEFPDRFFGDSQAYGLIAQDVEQVLPDLVVTGADGFKAVDYSKLPLLTIQAVKELKAENDALAARNAALEHRVAELERLVTELLAASGRR